MKRLFPLFVLIAAFITLTACASLPSSPHGELSEDGAVTMTTQFPVYAKDIGTIQVEVYNGSEEELTFGSVWRMEVLKKGEWKRIPFRENTAFNDIAYILSPGGTHIFTVYTKGLDYSIADGTYRIVKEIAGTAYAAEFTVGRSRISADAPYGYRPLEDLPAGYSADDAWEDGVIFVNSLGESDSAVLNTFFSGYETGMNTQLRLGVRDENGNLILEDILCERISGVWRIRYRRDETRAGGAITETIGSYLVTDGQEICLSCRPQWQKDSDEQVPVKLLKGFDWIGHDEVKARLRAQNERTDGFAPLRPAYWSPDGKTWITLHDDPLAFVVSQLSEGGGCRGYMTGIADTPGMTAIRSVIWNADSTIAVLICDAETKGMTGYVSYSIDGEKVVGYTFSSYGYTVKDGEIVIPE